MSLGCATGSWRKGDGVGLHWVVLAFMAVTRPGPVPKRLSAAATPNRGPTVLGPVRPLRRGVASERYVTCSKAGCACAHDSDARHGPYFSLTRAVRGRTRTRLVSAEEAVVVRRQIEQGCAFRSELEVCWHACERVADAELEGMRAVQAEEGGFRWRSPRRLQPRSRS